MLLSTSPTTDSKDKMVGHVMLCPAVTAANCARAQPRAVLGRLLSTATAVRWYGLQADTNTQYW